MPHNGCWLALPKATIGGSDTSQAFDSAYSFAALNSSHIHSRAANHPNANRQPAYLTPDIGNDLKHINPSPFTEYNKKINFRKRYKKKDTLHYSITILASIP